MKREIVPSELRITSKELMAVLLETVTMELKSKVSHNGKSAGYTLNRISTLLALSTF
jgi:hypothetical protein